jgi:hypothetical protein
MAGGGGGQKTTTQINEDFKPYIQYALSQGQNLYKNYAPAPETLAVGPSADTTQAMNLARERALAGSPLLKAAQEEQLATIQGRGVNPFLADALAQTNRLSGEAYTRNIENLQSKASSMGRYGSSAMGQQAGTAQDVFARALAEQSGQLAYNSAEAERGRQVAAAVNAPTMSSADYADIQRLLQVGQGAEGYAQKAIEGQLAAGDIPMQRLAKAAGVFYGAPLETTTTSTPTGGK